MRVRLAVLVVTGVLGGPSLLVSQAPALDGVAAGWPLDLVRSLPWAMEVTDSSEVAENLGPEACATGVERRLSHRLRSTEPVTTSAGRGVPLRLELSLSDYPAPCAAEEALEATLAGASPDTGLSYAWDLLLLAGRRLARLYAECAWSEEWFAVVAGELESRIEQAESRVARKVLCRCGGGCSEVETEQSANEEE